MTPEIAAIRADLSARIDALLTGQRIDYHRRRDLHMELSRALDRPTGRWQKRALRKVAQLIEEEER